MDIEENIKILENLKKYLNLLIYEGTHKIIYNDLGWDEKTIDCINAIDHILAEREEDKKKIEELEKENKRKDMFVKMAKEVIEESILKQKIKEKIKDLEYNSSLGFEETLEESYKIEVLQELLEDK